MSDGDTSDSMEAMRMCAHEYMAKRCCIAVLRAQATQGFLTECYHNQIVIVVLPNVV